MTRDEFLGALNNGYAHFKYVDSSPSYDGNLCKGDIVEFKADDGTCAPLFYLPNKRNMMIFGRMTNTVYIDLDCLEPARVDIDKLVKAKDDFDKAVEDYETNSTDTNAHYVFDGIQPIEYCQKVLTQEQFEGACIKDIIKYLSRFGKKDEKLKEAKKVIDYALWLAMSVGDKKVDPMKHNHTEIFKALGIEL